MLLSTGVIPPNTSEGKVRQLLKDRADDRGLKPDWKTLSIKIPRPGMKVAVVEAK